MLTDALNKPFQASFYGKKISNLHNWVFFFLKSKCNNNNNTNNTNNNNNNNNNSDLKNITL